MDAAHNYAHQQCISTQEYKKTVYQEAKQSCSDASNEANKNSSDAKEVAIQANDYEIERKFSHLPARKRYIPLKFSDYRVFDGSGHEEIKREEQEEEEEEKSDSTFKPIKSLEKKSRKPQKRRGRQRRNGGASVSGQEEDAISGNQPEEIDGKALIVKVPAGFKCTLCEHIFTLKGNAKSHLITHTDKRPFSCDFEGCGKKLRTKEALRRHQLSHLGIRMYECNICKKKLSTNISLQEHMALHSGEKPLACPICGRKFRQKTVMNRHIITHTTEKPYACTVCGKRFSMKVYVKSHMKTHTGERPFTCETCSKSFAHASDLKRHKIIHTGEKPYACSICSMRYNDVSSRKRHEREHQTGQQYLCSMCNQRFSRAGHLRTHLVRAHNLGSNGLYEVHSVDKGAEESWPPGTHQPKYVSLLPSSQHLNLLAQKEQAASQDGENKESSPPVQLFAGSSDASFNDIKASSPEKSSGQILEKSEKPEENIELSVLDPALERLDTLQPGYTYKIIDHPNSSNVLEFRLEESEAIQTGSADGFNLGGTLGESSLTVIKDEGSNTFMVIQQAPGQNIGGVGPHEQQPVKMVSKPTITSSGQWQVCVNSPGVQSVPDQVQPIVQSDASQVKISSAEPNENFSTINVIADQVNNTKESLSLLPEIVVASPPVKAKICDTKNSGASILSSSEEALKYIDHPDFTSQDYYNWLSAFTEECKVVPLPLQKEMFQRISKVQKTLTDFMALPSGVITDKNNFKVLMSITKDLSDIMSNHLMLMYQNLS